MINAGNKRLMLLLLTLAMLVCGVMALGSTLAGGVNRGEGETATDVPNGSAKMDYDVDILYSNSVDGVYQNLLTGAPFADALWCPGYTKIVYVQVRNREPFAIEATLNLKVEENALGDTMTYAVISPTNGKLYIPDNWGDFLKDTGKHNAVLAEDNSYNIFDEELLHQNQSATYAVAINMSVDASNEYKGKSMEINFDFRVDSDYAPTN